MSRPRFQGFRFLYTLQIMQNKVLITGGSGLLGQTISSQLTHFGYEVIHLSRNPYKNSSYRTLYWNYKKKEIAPEALTNLYAIIHLAGANIAEKRWIDKQKQNLENSRIESGQFLLLKLQEYNESITHFISASAIGYYSGNNESEHNESSKPGKGFIAQLCLKWENTALGFSSVSKNISIIRIGLVLSNKGGVFPKLVNAAKYYAGSPLGSGNQSMPWIHIDDVANICVQILNGALKPQIYNAVSNEHITNKAFTRLICKLLHKPLMPRIPAIVLKIIFGERATLFLHGNAISPKALNDEGYSFRFATSTEALKALLKK